MQKLITDEQKLITNKTDWMEEPKGNVLLVDDDPTILKIFSRSLRQEGYVVVELLDGEQVANTLKSKKIDVVMSDINMPGMDGLEVLRVVHAFDSDLPVILMTSNAQVNTAIKAVEYGAVRYLTKPVELEMVSKTLKEALQLHRKAKVKTHAMSLYNLAEKEKENQRELAERFEDALKKLYMVYQPIVSCSTGKQVAYEALLRTESSEFSDPSYFVKTAEQLNRLEDLGQQVRKAVALSIHMAPADTSIFVNLHPKELLMTSLYETDSEFSRYAKRIVFEITEVESIESLLDLDEHLKQLRAIGYRIAIDDLGSGYSALNSLPLLRPEFVKFDKTFLKKIHDDTSKQKLISLITSYCRDIGVISIAEGIETADIRDMVIKLGCDLVQGYLYAKPEKNFQYLS